MAKRQSIHIAGFSHKNPIPAGCRLGALEVHDVLKVGAPVAVACLQEFIEPVQHYYGDGPRALLR